MNEQINDLAIELPDGKIQYMNGSYDEFIELCKKDPAHNFCRPWYGKVIKKTRPVEDKEVEK